MIDWIQSPFIVLKFRNKNKMLIRCSQLRFFLTRSNPLVIGFHHLLTHHHLSSVSSTFKKVNDTKKRNLILNSSQDFSDPLMNHVVKDIRSNFRFNKKMSQYGTIPDGLSDGICCEIRFSNSQNVRRVLKVGDYRVVRNALGVQDKICLLYLLDQKTIELGYFDVFVVKIV